jgi:HAD superfamily hydrolase (TIGR01549 family)
MIKAVIFDIDGVLLDSQLANTTYIQDFMVSEGYPRPSKEITILHKHLALRDMIKTLTQSTDEKLINELWHRANQFPYPINLLKIPLDAHDVIARLKDKYQIGIVTNRMANHTDFFFQAYGSADDFTVVVTMSDIKNPKPDPEPMLLAIDKLDVLPEETVYIGDSLSDLQSAKNAGAKCIILGYPEIAGADAYVDSLSELPTTIQKL